MVVGSRSGRMSAGSMDLDRHRLGVAGVRGTKSLPSRAGGRSFLSVRTEDAELRNADFQVGLVGGAGFGGQARTSGTTSSGRFDDGWHGCMFDCTE